MNSFDCNHVWTGGVRLKHVGPTDCIVEEDVRIFGVMVPKGFRTDGASVPRAFYNIIPRFTDALLAALVHDLRYDPPDKIRLLTRKEADQEFRDNLKACGVNFARRQAAYRAVRLFGGIPWSRGSKRGIINAGDFV